MKPERPISLRERQATPTRDQILNEAYELLVNHPDKPFSHEAIAARTGIGARTVYRYFPAQSDLDGALWMRLRQEAGTIFFQRKRKSCHRSRFFLEGLTGAETKQTAKIGASARMLVMVTLGDFNQLFEELSSLNKGLPSPDLPRTEQLMNSYGLDLLGPPLS